MNPADQQLVQQITQQVLAILQQRAASVGGSVASAPDVSAGSAASPAPAVPIAAVRPPVGTCTGDYSQFPELAGKLHALRPAPATTASAPSIPASGSSASANLAQLPLAGIVTANQLRQAMDRSPDRVATLAPDARLTPLANDLARQFPQRLRRAALQAVQPQAAAPWVWWIDGSCPLVEQLTSVRTGRLQALGADRQAESLIQVIRELATALRDRRIAGGILFVRSAARAVCLANRCPSLRAVVGTCPEAVEQGIAEVAANVLVIEYPHHGLYAMSNMADRIMQQNPQPSPQVQRDLADLHRQT